MMGGHTGSFCLWTCVCVVIQDIFVWVCMCGGHTGYFCVGVHVRGSYRIICMVLTETNRTIDGFRSGSHES
jgi:hypothetical protein